jgi:hypothetical protein
LVERVFGVPDFAILVSPKKEVLAVIVIDSVDSGLAAGKSKIASLDGRTRACTEPSP